MKLVFRVDASNQIGIGHLMRCLTLAKAMQAKGATSTFISTFEHEANAELLRKQGHGLQTLPRPKETINGADGDLAHAHWLGRSQTEDSLLTSDLLKMIEPDLLIVDHYGIDHRWHQAVRPACGKIMVIDDIADRQHACDLLLDQNLFADAGQRYLGKVPKNARTLLGPEYALLQPDFTRARNETEPRKPPVKNIFVYFGNADQFNLAGLAIKSFLALDRDDLHLHAVINPVGPYVADINGLAHGNETITLYTNLPSLAPLMRKCELAIGAGGATSWERCCLGLPALVITLADNQVPLTTKLAEDGYVNWLGDQKTVSEATLTTALSKALANPDLESWSAKCMTLVDGKGADRVCSAIMEL